MKNNQAPDRIPVNWPVVIMFIATISVAVIVVPWYGFVHGYSTTAWVVAALLWLYCGLAIGGYHRLWSHRTYQAHPALKVFFALGGALALQNSALVWCARHRVHHQYVDDNDRDPYSIGRGFWFAHMGWMTRDYPSCEVDFSRVNDLKRDPIVAWQHKHYWSLVWLMNLGLPAAIGWATGEFWGMVLLAGVLRLVVNHQVTFFINSLAHMWGSRPYSDENSARDNWLIALVTFGEGYHNFHHKFQTDYRNGVRWWQFDINKWFVALCSFFGLATSLKRVPKFRILRARLHTEFRRVQARMEANAHAARWKETLDTEYQQFLETVKAWQALQKERVQTAREALRQRWEKTFFRTRIRELEYRLKMQRKRITSLAAALSVR